jgi:dihydrofolate reductase
MIISIIVAVAENNAIGFKNQLLFKISDDLKRFKTITTGHTVIMGRNTFLSLPNGALPNRVNIVITDNSADNFKDCIMANSINDALNKCPQEETECFVIGGGMIYKQFYELSHRLYLTKIHRITEADTFFPEVDYNKWQIISKEDHLEAEPPYTYLILERNN